MSYKLSSSSSNNSNSMPPLRLTGLYQARPVAPLDSALITERIETAPLSHTRSPKAYPVVREDFLPRSMLTAKPLMGTSSYTVGECYMLLAPSSTTHFTFTITIYECLSKDILFKTKILDLVGFQGEFKRIRR